MTTVPALAELNFVVIPLLSTSHLIPLADMAKLLAQQGVTVTLLTTPRNAAQFTASIDRAVRSGLLIRVVELQSKAKEAGLLEGCENHNDVTSLNYRRQFFASINMLQEQAEKLLEEMKPKPSCIISDAYVAWTADTADKFQIPRIVFDGMSCFNQMCMHNLYIMRDQHKIPESGAFVMPDLPDRIEVTKAQLPGYFKPPATVFIQDIREKIRAAEERAYGVVINTFEELEQRYVDKFRGLKDGRVWCVGPLSLCNNDNLDKSQRGNKASFEREDSLKKWLDSWQAETVVYACFGSLGNITVVQFVELALGLEASGYPFILVIKTGEGQAPIEDWISKNDFEERIKERGLLIRGWAPQLLILSHPAIGGFLTHCGWNSTLEGISAGLPMITWPLFAEQFLTERFLVHVLKMAAGVGSQSHVHLGMEEKLEVQVSNKMVKDAITKVMDKEKEGKEMRKRARELGEMAKRAVEGDGSSHLNVKLLIKEIQEFHLNQSAKMIYNAQISDVLV
ncbi:UDP-glycosyltransferase 73C4 [Capsicum annuum]